HVRKTAEEHVWRLAHHDTLTDLPNRAGFLAVAQRCLMRATRTQERLAVLFIDLDRFKQVNDNLGHKAGDRVLQEISQRMRAALRASDLVARHAGDEFIVLLEDVRTPAEVGCVADKILHAASAPLRIGNADYSVSASIGIALYPEDGRDVDTLVQHADIAMYRAKKISRNAYQFYNADLEQDGLEQLTLTGALANALKRDELFVLFQPKMSLSDRRIVGVEALARWHHPERGLISPNTFIPIAEEAGLMPMLTRVVLRKALAAVAGWRSAGVIRPPVVAVNISASHFEQDDFLDDIEEALREADMAGSQLEIELTESAVAQHPERAAELLRSLRLRGVQVSLDDFGTGYSSLAQLRRFRIDTVKIDRSFVAEIPGNANDESIVLAIVQMARGLRLQVIAEGIEHESQAAFLDAIGCHQGQGFHFHRPMTEAAMLALLLATHDPEAHPVL
ncbi:MAG: EAL domain-containing protein, partial [Burkholderiales bacterium]|nr:EAL domain-containing protein [Burkholderiales bacterium]